MPAPASLLARMRGSVLGAWLAVAYALAVLAVALAPVPAAATGLPGGILLCSGVPVPEDGPLQAPAPLGELGHCKGCPYNPVSLAPPALEALVVARALLRIKLLRQPGEGQLLAFAIDLPPSRAPPAA